MSQLRISMPSLKSPVFFGVFIWGAYSLYALSAPGFGRTIEQYLSIVLTCFILDTLFFYFRSGELRLTLSGFISGFALFFLVDTAYIEIGILVAALTMVTKHLFTYRERHIFNPTNLALLIVCYGFSDITTFHAMRWGGELIWSIIFIMLGALITIYANRWVVAVTYAAAFTLFAYIKSLIFPAPFDFLMLPLMGPALQLFTFFMITDPQTSPPKKSQQFVFAIAVAALDSALRFMQNRYAPLLSLSIICLAFTLYEVYKNSKNETLFTRVKTV